MNISTWKLTVKHLPIIKILNLLICKGLWSKILY